MLEKKKDKNQKGEESKRSEGDEMLRFDPREEGTFASSPSGAYIFPIGSSTCNVCGHPMYDDEGREDIGVSINLSEDHPEADRVKEVFGKQSFNVCFVCFLRALGVKESKVEEKTDG